MLEVPVDHGAHKLVDGKGVVALLIRNTEELSALTWPLPMKVSKKSSARLVFPPLSSSINWTSSLKDSSSTSMYRTSESDRKDKVGPRLISWPVSWR